MNEVKAILMDLGNTIIYNKTFDFIKGMKKIYQLSDKRVKEDEYFNITRKLIKERYIRDITNREVKLYEFLEEIDNLSKNTTSYDYQDLEFCFLKEAANDIIVDNIIDFLEYAKQLNIPIVILSNSTFSHITLKKELEEMNIMKYFVDLISSSDTIFRKPTQEIFNIGVSRIKQIDDSINQKDIAYIGNDYTLDMVGAYNSNLKPYWFNEKNKCDINNCCYFIFKNYLDLIKHFK